jgi:hypothetical protein
MLLTWDILVGGNVMGSYHWEELGLDGRIILKWAVRK